MPQHEALLASVAPEVLEVDRSLEDLAKAQQKVVEQAGAIRRTNDKKIRAWRLERAVALSSGQLPPPQPALDPFDPSTMTWFHTERRRRLIRVHHPIVRTFGTGETRAGGDLALPRSEPVIAGNFHGGPGVQVPTSSPPPTAARSLRRIAMSVAAIVAPAPSPIAHRMPGGGSVTEHWPGAHDVVLEVSGELDLYDEPALVDLLTALIFGGASRIRIDVGPGTFVGLAVLRGAQRVRRFLARRDGDLEVRGLRAPLDQVWAAMTPPASPHRSLLRDGPGSPIVA